MFYRYPDVVWAQKIWSHPPSSTRNSGTKLAIWHFWQLWNFTLKKLGSLSFLMKHMFFWSSDNVWAHHHLLQLDIWAQKRLSDTFFTSKTLHSKNVDFIFVWESTCQNQGTIRAQRGAPKYDHKSLTFLTRNGQFAMNHRPWSHSRCFILVNYFSRPDWTNLTLFFVQFSTSE